MQYENGKEFTFESNGCKAHVTLENFKPETKEKFNQVLAREKLKEYKENKSEDVGA
jgi:hypothetical protein